MQNETTADNIMARFERWMLEPLKKDLADQNRRQFATFVLLSVAIDNLASMRYSYELPDRVKGNVKKRYQKFIENYFPTKYRKHAAVLYTGFRCQLVHAFQSKGVDLQQEEESRKHHLGRLRSGNICLNASEFFNDLVGAFEKYKGELAGPSADPKIVAALERAGYKPWVHTTVSA